MIFCQEQNRKHLRSLKARVQRDREAGEYIPPNFDSILQSLDEMAARNDAWKASDVDVADTYRPGRKEYEILQAYNLLIKAGGRPICTLEDINHVSEDPERHFEILAPWIGGYSTSDGSLDWKVIFRQQLLNWRKFRAWQRAHRDISAQRGPMHSPSGGSFSSSSTLEAHVGSTRERLERYGFTKPFFFNDNAEKQDDWTTWVEYMSYEAHINITRQKGPESSFYDHSEISPMDHDGSSASELTDDAIGEETMRLNDTKHHRLILRWIVLQEPEIAAVSLQQASSMGSETAMAKNGLGRFKRLRDGSLRGSVPGGGQFLSGDCPNDDASEQEAKRCRTSA
ncbi:hypothetical protein E4U56_000355 [Claviceps arundinis]|uniref:Uncharacterized protein n=1 Tax=Claviceps arundinis TaxID=1623583 RepID=A0A9P7MU63_9HYPO|nr:hypothetical protein E4U56_000355 [Claviceps arundinis]